MLLSIAAYIMAAPTHPQGQRIPKAENQTQLAILVSRISKPNRLILPTRTEVVKGCAGNWVPAWRGFAIGTEEGIYSIGVDGTMTFRARLRHLHTLLPKQWAVSPDGRLIGEFDHILLDPASLTIRELASGRILLELGNAELAKALGKALASANSSVNVGVAWRPDSRSFAFGHTFGTVPDNGGVSPSRIASVDCISKRLRSHGEGSPIAFVSNSTILARTGDDIRTVDISGRVVSRFRRSVVASNWDGAAVVLVTERRGQLGVERWTPDFQKRLGRRRLSDWAWEDFTDGIFVQQEPKH
jgi:hypothetical protein